MCEPFCFFIKPSNKTLITTAGEGLNEVLYSARKLSAKQCSLDNHTNHSVTTIMDNHCRRRLKWRLHSLRKL